MENKPNSLPELNKFIAKFWPNIKIKKGNGYFYLYSNDEEIDLKISGLYSSSVEGMWPLSAFTFEQWKSAIKQTLDDDQGGRGSSPVFENRFKLRNILKTIKKGK